MESSLQEYAAKEQLNDRTYCLRRVHIQLTGKTRMTKQIDTSRIDYRFRHNAFNSDFEDHPWRVFLRRCWTILIGCCTRSGKRESH